MLKQLPSRNQRTKGFKVKHGFQIFLLIAVGIWLLYQLKHSLDKKKEYEESSAKTIEKLQSRHETKKLGRKGFQPRIRNPNDLINDVEESKPEKIKEKRGGGENEIVGHDQDRVEEEESEEVEDLIDEEDKEREEENEEEESEDMGKQIEDMSSLKDQSHHDGEKDSKEKSEKQYKENGASRIIMRQTQSIGAEFEFEGLENSEKIEIPKLQNKIMAPSEIVVLRTDSSCKVVDNVTIEHGSFHNVVIDFSESEAGSNSDSLLKMEMIEPGAYHNLTRMLLEATGSLHGTTANENEKASGSGIGKDDNLEKAQHQ